MTSEQRTGGGRRGRRVTIHAIAEAAGVSSAAASKALNSRPGVSARKRLRVQRVAQQLGYSPYVTARRTGMSRAGGRRIAVLHGPVSAHLVREAQRGIDTVLRFSGFFSITCHLLPDDPEKVAFQDLFLRTVLEDPAVAGLLAAFVELPSRTIEQLAKHNVPTVFLDGPRSHGAYGNVAIDHVRAAGDAVAALMKLGRRHIGYIGPRADLGWVWAERIRGAKDAVERARGVFAFEPEPFTDLVEAAQATRRLVERDQAIDGLVYASDIQMAGGLRMLAEMGIDVPRRIAVIGFDDSEICRTTSPTMSSVHQPIERMGAAAARMLLSAISGRRSALRQTTLRSHVVLRGTCRVNHPSDRLLRRAP